jgi:hypothetical protein
VFGLAFCPSPRSADFLEVISARPFDVAFDFSGRLVGGYRFGMEAEKDLTLPNMAHALDAGLRLGFIRASLARASDAQR